MEEIFSKLTLSDWGSIGNIILGIASVFTAIVTAIVLCKQYNIQKETLLYQQLVQQPIFNIYYELIDSDNDGKYENEILNISNEGYLLKQIKTISITTIFDVATNDKHSLVKINGYFSLNTRYQNLKGLLCKSRGNNNKEKYCNIYNQVVRRSHGKLFHDMYKYDLIKIEYIDIHNNNKVCCFKDRTIIEENTFNEIYDQIINKQSFFDIDKITFEDLFINEIK